MAGAAYDQLLKYFDILLPTAADAKSSGEKRHA
jgi:hypothetical protein